MEVENRKKKKSLFLPLGKALPYLGLILGLAIYLFQSSISFYSEEAFGKILIQVVEKEFNNDYQVNYEDIRFNIFTRKLNVVNFTVQSLANSNLVKDTKALRVHSNSFMLDIESIFEFLFRNKLTIQRLNLENPEIFISTSKKVDSTGNINPDSLIQVTLEKLSFLKVQALKIENASINIIDPEDLTHFGNISLSIENLGIDQNEKLDGRYDLNSTVFEVTIEDEEFDIGDYKLVIDRVHLSKFDSIVSVEGIHLSELHGDNKVLAELDLVEISDFNILTILSRMNINPGKLLIKNGNVKLDIASLRQNGNKKKTQKPFDFTETITIDTIALENIDVQAYVKPENQIDTLSFDDINLSVYPVLINKDQLNDPQRIIDSIDFIVEVGKYHANLFDNNQWGVMDELYINTHEKRLSVKNIDITPYNQRENYFATNDLKLEAYGVDKTGFIRRREIVLDSLNISSYKLDMRFFRNPSSMIVDSISNERLNPVPLLSSLLERIKLKKLNIKVDTFLINETHIRNRIYGLNTTTNNILLDSTTILLPHRIFRNNSISFSNSNLYLKKSGIFASMSSFNKTSTGLEFRNLRLRDTNQNTFLVSINRLSLDSRNIFRQLLQQNIQIDKILMDQPKVVYNPLPKKAEPEPESKSKILIKQELILDTLLIREIVVNDGTIDVNGIDSDINIERWRSIVSDLRIIPGINDYNLGKLMLDISEVSAVTSANDSISTKNVFFSSSDKNLRLNQNSFISRRENDITEVVVPNIYINIPDINDLIFRQKLITGESKILNPSVKLITGKNQEKNKNEQTKGSSNKFLVPMMLSTGPILIEKGIVEIEVGEGEKQLKIKIPEYDLSIPKYTVQQNQYLYLDRVIDKTNLLAHNVTVEGLADVDTLFIGNTSMVPNAGLFFNDVLFGGYLNKNYLDIQVKSIGLNDERLSDIVLDAGEIHEVSLYRPVIQMKRTNRDIKKKESDNNSTTPLKIAYIDVREGVLQVDDNLEVNNLSVNVNQFKIPREESEKHIYNMDGVQLAFGSATYDLPDDLNQLQLNGFNYSSLNGMGSIQKLSSTPLLDQAEYGIKVGKQTDWITLNTGVIDVDEFDLYNFIEEGVLDIRTLKMNDLDLLVYRDRNIPFDEDQRRSLPQTVLRSSKMPINIQELKLSNTSITYEELAVDGEAPGKIYFHELDGNIQNLTNMEESIKENSIMHVDAVSKFMGEGNLSTTFDFRLDSANDYFTVEAEMGSMDLQLLNQFLNNNMFVYIKEGECKKLALKSQATNDVSWGTMEFLYNDLKISMINKQTFDTHGAGPAIISFFANSFVINTNNPHFFQKRVGDIYFERDKKKSLFNFLSKTAVSGIISSVGAKNNRKEINRMYKQQEEERKKRMKEEKNKKKNNPKKLSKNEKLDNR